MLAAFGLALSLTLSADPNEVMPDGSWIILHRNERRRVQFACEPKAFAVTASTIRVKRQDDGTWEVRGDPVGVSILSLVCGDGRRVKYHTRVLVD